MRVIAGLARGRRLASVPGDETRPITDRAKEALFSILGTRVVGARWLDLFAGTGSVGIEALSRGADAAVFIERSPAALKTVAQNLQHTRLAEGATVVRGDAFRYLAGPVEEPFDYVFVAPPQYQGLWLRALLLLDGRPELLAPAGEVIVQIHPKEYVEPDLAALQLVDTRRYGSVQLDFYNLKD